MWQRVSKHSGHHRRFHLGIVLAIVAPTGPLARAVAADAKALTLYVAADGRDTWSGKTARPAADGSDGPLASLAGARDRIRAIRKEAGDLKQPVTVSIGGGTYRLSEPFVLTPDDSGTAEFPVTYAAQPGETPVISGGRAVGGFKPVEVDGRRLWAADVPDVRDGKWYFSQLFVNGRRCPRSRLPKDGFYNFAELPDLKPDAPWNVGQKRAKFAPGHIRAWSNLGDVEVVVPHFWVDSRLPIASVDEAAQLVTFTRTSIFRMTEEFSMRPARYWIENVFEALDTPGQWYLNRQTGILYYVPLPGETPDTIECVAPRLTQVVHLKGDAPAGRPVRHVNLVGLTFSHTQWALPADSAGAAQAAWNVPGAILLEGAESCRIERCTVRQAGTYAIELAGPCRDNHIIGNVLTDLGAGGVKLGHGTASTTVADNVIADGGHIFHAAVGVWIGNSGRNTVAHNDIHHLYYTGVSVGWSWGYGPSNATHNIVEYNHIHDIGRGLLSDMGGIYTLGVSPGTQLRHNRIHDIESSGYGGWGIYLDEGSTTILVENNIVFRTKTGGFHQHYGKDNTIRNNIFAFARDGQIQRTREEQHAQFTFERNIVYWKEGPLLHGNWKGDTYKFDYNVYFNAADRPVDFAGASLEQWQKRGMDVHSRIADPLFADPDRGDFTLKPGSPARDLGFEPIDLSTAGPRKPLPK